MPRSRLLISVRNVAEAADALTAGTDLLDVKEPHHGALGMAQAETIRAVLALADGHVPTSVALGELLEGNSLPPLERQPTFAKFGLAGAGRLSDWHAQLRSAMGTLPRGVQPVAVAYADWRAADAPAPREVLEAAIELECRGLLLDTFGKTGGSLVEQLSATELGELLARARECGLVTVLAGGLRMEHAQTLASLAPDYFGFRGAACRDGREAILDPQRVRALRQALEGDKPLDQSSLARSRLQHAR